MTKQITDYKKQSVKIRATTAHPSHLKSAISNPALI